MAADIKNYLKEKEKRQKNQDDYKKKIRKHKLTIVYRVLLVAAALGAALALVVVQAKRHIYTGYDTLSSKQGDFVRCHRCSLEKRNPYL